MKIQRIYIDTSVIGGCHDEEFAPWSKGLMRDFRLGVFKPVLSEIVALEIMDAPELVRRTYAELLSLEPEMLEVTEEALRLAESYQTRNIPTPKFFDDGLHIALATTANVDIFDKILLFNAINIEQGYKMLHIHSPREVTYNAE